MFKIRVVVEVTTDFLTTHNDAAAHGPTGNR